MNTGGWEEKCSIPVESTSCGLQPRRGDSSSSRLAGQCAQVNVERGEEVSEAGAGSYTRHVRVIARGCGQILSHRIVEVSWDP
jgi:hypothetical protein